MPKLPFRRTRRLLRQARTGASVLVSKVLRRDERKTARNVTKSLGKMKGVAMKVGQAQSYQSTGMSEPWQEALATLQQDAPSMSAKAAAKVVEAELGRAPEKVFKVWTPTPVAAASVGQVHRAVTHDGHEVAVKVQFPMAEDAFRSDVENVSAVVRKTVARKKMDVEVDGKKTDLDPGLLTGVFSEFEKRLVQEVDYCREADNQELIGAAFAGNPKMHVPAVYRDLSARRVLTTEFAQGSRFDEVKRWSQEERDAAGETIFRFHYRCILDVGTYNVDPHPGNYLFRPGGDVTFLDFGAVGETPPAFVEWVSAWLAKGVEPEPGRVPTWLAEQLTGDGPRPLVMPKLKLPQGSAGERRPPGARPPVDRPVRVPPLPMPGVLYGLQAIIAQLGAVADWSAIVREIGDW